jgi:hypothetical protein
MDPWLRSTSIAITCAITLACSSESAVEQVDHGSAGKESSLTGCVTQGDNGRSFILRAENEPQPQGNERPERPTSSPNVYRLAAYESLNIERHVNNRVTVTGYLETVPVHAAGDAGGTLVPAPTSGVNTAPQDSRTDLIDMKVFKVISLEALGSCSG